MVSKGFPNVTTSGRQYNIGDKPSVVPYAYINFQGHQHHNPFYLSPGLQCNKVVLNSLGEVKVIFNKY